MEFFATPDGTNPKYTGQQRDQETSTPGTSIDWFQVRYLSGAQGRFQSPDPGNAGADPSNPQSWNGYAYVGNNPLSYTDPSGMAEDDGDDGGGGGGDDGGDFFGGFSGGGGGGSHGTIPPSLATPSSPIMGDFPEAVDISGLSGGWWSQCGFLYGSVCGVAPANVFGLDVTSGLVPIFHAEATAKRPRDVNAEAAPLSNNGKPNDAPSCFGNFLKNWVGNLAPWPTSDHPEPAEIGRVGAEAGAFYYQAKAWEHAAARNLRYVNKSGIFRSWTGLGEMAEKAAGPGFVVAAGVFAYIDDLKQRQEGLCQPFGWEN
jgi:RHS repeat-associated protein